MWFPYNDKRQYLFVASLLQHVLMQVDHNLHIVSVKPSLSKEAIAYSFFLNFLTLLKNEDSLLDLSQVILYRQFLYLLLSLNHIFISHTFKLSQ